MELMPTQREDLDRAIENAGGRLREVTIAPAAAGATIHWKAEPSTWWCRIERQSVVYRVTMRPGRHVLEESREASTWSSALSALCDWVEYVQRETSVAAGDPTAPDWLRDALPERYGAIEQELERLRSEQQKLEDMGRLIWQTGTPLDLAVAAAFTDLGYKCEPTKDRATYDVRVELGDGRRLFIEVTGVDGAILKGSRKVGQIVDTHQLSDFDDSRDRVIVAANVFRKTAPPERGTPVSPDALRIIQRLRANILPTPTLYRWWLRSLRGETDEVRRAVDALHAQDGGVFTDPLPSV